MITDSKQLLLNIVVLRSKRSQSFEKKSSHNKKSSEQILKEILKL